jgi:hypothetical protein
MDTYSQNGEMFRIFKKLDLPTLDQKFFSISSLSNINKSLESVLLVLDRKEDVLYFLDRNRANKTFMQENKKNFIKFINESFIRNKKRVLTFASNDNSMPEYKVKEIIRNLPIFTDLFDYIPCLQGKKYNALDLTQLPLNGDFLTSQFFSQIQFKCDFIQFCNGTNRMIIPITTENKNVIEYLNIQKISIYGLYVLFFEWCFNPIEPPTKINCILIDHVNYLRQMHSILILDDILLTILKRLPFIFCARIKSYKSVPECHDYKNELFNYGFKKTVIEAHENFDLQDKGWTKFFKLLDLKTKCNANDCIYLAQKINSDYQNKIITEKELNKYSVLLLKEIRSIIYPKDDKTIDKEGLTLLENIKSIRFMPNYYNINEKNSFHSRLYKTLFGNQNDLVCLEDSIFKDMEDFCWLKKRILPDFCQKAIISESPLDIQANSAILNAAKIISKLDPNLLIENLIILSEYLSSPASTLNNLSKMDYQKLEQIFSNNFSALQKYAQEPESDVHIFNALKRINLILNKSINGKIKFSPIKIFFKHLKRSNHIDGELQKIPLSFSKFWKFFEFLDAKEKVDYEKCQYLLQSYYEQTKGNELSSEKFNSVLKVFKMLVDDDLLSKHTKDQLDLTLYAPNHYKQMKDIKTLYFADNSMLELLVETSSQIKNICIFDIKLLIKQIESSTDDHDLNYDSSEEQEENTLKSSSGKKFKQDLMDEFKNDPDSNFLRNFMLKRLNWNLVFLENPHFKRYPHLAPKRLSEILYETIEQLGLNEDIEMARNAQLHSSQFINCVVKVVKLFLENQSEYCTDLNEFLSSEIATLIKNTKIYEKDIIKSFFINTLKNEKVDNSDKERNFARFRSNETNEMKFLIKKGFADEFEINFYLAETIFEEIERMLSVRLAWSSKEERSSRPNDLNEKIKSLQDSLKKRVIRFIFILIKLLKCDNENEYDDIILDYKLKSLYSIN